MIIKYLLLIIFITLSCTPYITNQQDDAISKIESERNIQVSEPNNETVKLSTITHVDTLGLKGLYPKFSKVDLVCGTMPSKNDTNVVLVMAAYYTGKRLNQFTHFNIEEIM